MKAVYTLRSFYGESEHTGEDLKARLVTLKKTTKTLGIALVLLVSIAGVVRDVHGESLPDNDKQPHLLPPATLEKSVQEVLSRREFAWRMPREKAVGKTEKGILDDVIVWMKPYVQAFRDTVKKWFEALGRWLKKMVHEKNSPDIIKGKEPKPLVRYLLYGLSALSLFLLAFYLIRWLRAFKKPVTPEDQNSAPAPDLSDETLKADDLPPSAWKTLAESLMADGEYRLAIRALYLATLSQLSEKRLITVAPYKSNREYLDELRMKAHEKLEMITLFNESVGLFDKVWYGRFSIGAPDVSAFSADQERIVAHAL